MRLANILFAMLLVLVGSSAGAFCRPAAAHGVQAAATVAAQRHASCEGRGEVECGLASAVAAGMPAVDASAEHEDRVEALAADVAAMPRPASSQAPAGVRGPGVPLPWLRGLLRPPRAHRA